MNLQEDTLAIFEAQKVNFLYRFFLENQHSASMFENPVLLELGCIPNERVRNLLLWAI